MENQKYLQITEKIIESKSFGRSRTYANLLRYLVKCTLDRDIPKETTIANEIFGKSAFDPSQSTLIRVYIYNLRKKLKTYYANEGSDDQLLLEIPKGSYAVSFSPKEETQVTNKRFTKKRVVVILLALLVLLSISGFLLHIRKDENSTWIEASLWADLLKSDKTTMLVLGDLYAYTEIDSVSGLTRSIRDPLINSVSEFADFKAADKREGITYESLSYTYLIRNSALWIKDLSVLFHEVENDFVIRTMSRFNPKELSDYDFIVVGMFKTLGLFEDYFEKSGFTFNARTDTLTYNVTPATGGIEKQYTPSGDADTYHTDYAAICKVPGPNNNVIYLFAGIWDTGTSQSLKNFTDPKLVRTLERAVMDKFGEIPKYYKILFEVNGVDRMELNSKILSIAKIEVDTNSL